MAEGEGLLNTIKGWVFRNRPKPQAPDAQVPSPTSVTQEAQVQLPTTAQTSETPVTPAQPETPQSPQETTQVDPPKEEYEGAMSAMIHRKPSQALLDTEQRLREENERIISAARQAATPESSPPQPTSTAQPAPGATEKKAA